MQLKNWTLAALLFALIPGISQARDTTHFLPFEQAVQENPRLRTTPESGQGAAGNRQHRAVGRGCVIDAVGRRAVLGCRRAGLCRAGQQGEGRDSQHGTDVLGQLTDETRPYRSALDGDLGEDFND